LRAPYTDDWVDEKARQMTDEPLLPSEHLARLDALTLVDLALLCPLRLFSR